MPTHETSALVEIEIFHVHWQFARSLFLAFLTAQGLKDQPKRPPQAAAVPRQPPARHSDTRSCPSASPLPPRRVSRPARTSSPGPSSPFLVSPDPPGQLQFRHRWPLASFSALPYHPITPSPLRSPDNGGSRQPVACVAHNAAINPCTTLRAARRCQNTRREGSDARRLPHCQNTRRRIVWQSAM
jgi:hypothetical protein